MTAPRIAVSTSLMALLLVSGCTGGKPGPSGAEGATGLPGPGGEEGPRGATGPAGATGATGSAGLMGAPGDTGSTGGVGATGAPGSAGATGGTGASGLAGTAGVAGANGSTGATGAAGSTGAIGSTGSTGAAGSMGATGVTGANGSAGSTGPTGPAGTTTGVSTDTPNTVVGRDGTGRFAADTITLDGQLAFSSTTVTMTADGGVVLFADDLVLSDGTYIGTGNVSLGVRALENSGTTYENTALGTGALSMTQASASTAVGDDALGAATTGFNTAVGVGALGAVTTGSRNTAVGALAGGTATTVTAETVVGDTALQNLVTGDRNTAIGQAALYHETNGGQNTAVGANALPAVATGTNDIGIGASAGNQYTAAESNNICIGSDGVAGESGTIHIGNVGTQTNAYVAGIYGTTITTGLPVVVDSAGHLGTSEVAGSVGVTGATGSPGATGAQGSTGSTGATGSAGTAGVTGAVGSTGVTGAEGNTGAKGATGATGSVGTTGPTGPAGTTTGVSTDTPNTVVGRDGTGSFAADSITLDGQLAFSSASVTMTADGGVVLFADYGAFSGSSLVPTGNVSLGAQALENSRTTADNTALGTNALSMTSGYFSTAVGANVLESATTGTNSAVGYGALASVTTGSGNTALGRAAGASATTVTAETVVGDEALTFLVTGDRNTALGQAALYNETNGAQNTAVGANALPAVVTGSNDIGIGAGAGSQYTAAESNNICIGADGVAGESGTIHIGNVGTQTNAYVAGIYGTGIATGVPVVVDSTGHLGTSSVTALGTPTDTANTLVERDGTGSFGADNVTLDGNLVFASAEFGSPSQGVLLSPAGLLLGQDAFSNLLVGVQGVPSITSEAYGNVGIGNSALASDVSGFLNVAVGTGALQTTNDQNSTAVGTGALTGSVSGTNDAFGYGSLASLSSGKNNVGVGQESLNALTAGSGNVALGANAGINYLATESNNVDIANQGSAGESGTIRIGTVGTQTAAYVAGVYGTSVAGGQAVVVNASGQLGTSSAAAFGVSTDTANTLVERNGSGSFSANTATLDGNLALSADSNFSQNTGVITNPAGLLLGMDGDENFLAGTGPSPSLSSGARQNVGIGPYALNGVTSGSANVAVGTLALAATNGQASTAVGNEALWVATAYPNDAFGSGSLTSLRSGSENVAVGANSLKFVTAGSGNVAVGNAAGNQFQGSESNNVDVANRGVEGESGVIRIGTPGTQTAAYLAGVSVTTISGGSPVVVSSTGQLGVGSAPSGMTWLGAYGGTLTTYVQNDVVSSSGTNYVCISSSGCTGDALTTTADWTPMSPVVSASDTASTLVERDASGDIAGKTLSADGNLVMTTANGTTAGAVLLNGDVVYAATAGFPSTGSQWFGLNASATTFSASATGTDNLGVGTSALLDVTSGGANVALGTLALGDLQTGADNIAIGAESLQHDVSGGSNVAIGSQALVAGTGSSNVAIGYQVLQTLTSGSSNIVLGDQAGSAYTSSETNNILIGNTGGTGDANVIRIGDAQVAFYAAGVSGKSVTTGAEVYVAANGQLGTVNSSLRFKQDVHDMGDDSETLMSLRPVSFRYKPEYDASGSVRYGLIAEEVEQVDPNLVVYDSDGQLMTVKYDQVNALLLNEVQRQQHTIEQQRADLAAQQATVAAALTKIDAQQSTIASLAERLNRLEARLSR